jgi:hypothetical protein
MPPYRSVIHLPFIFGASAALYAGSLALTTSLQAGHDAAVADARLPLVQAVQQTRLERVRATIAVRGASSALEAAGLDYARLGTSADRLADALSTLAAGVQRATGSAARLPTSVSLPAAPSTTVVVGAPAPTTNGTTGASGR